MKKSVVTILVLMLIGTSAICAQTVSYDAAVRNIVTQIVRAIDDDEIIAIMNFDSTSEQFSTRLIDDITLNLINDGVRVVERQQLEAVLQEQNFQLSGNVSDESMQSIGHMLGASSIIIGHGENMADHYRINFRVLSVETARIKRQIAQNVTYNANMRRLLAGGATSDNIGSTKIYLGGMLGLGIGLHSMDSEFYSNYYTGGGIEPKEESGVGFPLSIYIGFQINDHWAVQSGLDFFFNNYVKVTGTGFTGEGSYNSLSIPILGRYTILFSPVTLNALAGFHLSFAMGKLSVEGGIPGYFIIAESASANNATFGMDIGVNAGYKLGPGNIVGGLLFTFDFNTIMADVAGKNTNIATRRALNIMVGYEYRI